ncbi:MAG: hypothetical protein ABW194_10385, partial [Novosphingobium sp.]
RQQACWTMLAALALSHNVTFWDLARLGFGPDPTGEVNENRGFVDRPAMGANLDVPSPEQPQECFMPRLAEMRRTAISAW